MWLHRHRSVACRPGLDSNHELDFPRFGGQGLIRSWQRWLVQ
jgi:hypothetical protein